MSGLLSGAVILADQLDAQQQDSVKTTTAGVYTAEQATRGQAAYNATCASCHTLSEHSNADFKFQWSGRTVFELMDIIRTTMPQDNPGGLKHQEYIDITAYILKLNAAPAGKDSLPADTAGLRRIKIEIKPPPAGR